MTEVYRNWPFSEEAEIARDIMTRNDEMFPFYRAAMQDMTPAQLKALNISGFGAFIRSEYKLWDTFQDEAIKASKSVLSEIWHRLR